MTPAQLLEIRGAARRAQVRLSAAVQELLDILPLLPPGSALAREVEASIDECAKARAGLERFACGQSRGDQS